MTCWFHRSRIGLKSGSDCSASAVAHDSAGVPPQLVWISPTGTFSDLCSSRPKKYPTAEKLLTVCGDEMAHDPSSVALGLPATAFFTVNMRTSG